MNFKRFKVLPGGYKYDRYIFWLIIIFCIGIITGQGIIEKWNFSYYFYFECKEGPCQNPLFNMDVKNTFIDYDYKKFCSADWCNEPLLETGEYGRKAPIILRLFPYIVIALVIIGLLLNHFIHNRGKKPELMLNVPDKWVRKFKELKED